MDMHTCIHAYIIRQLIHERLYAPPTCIHTYTHTCILMMCGKLCAPPEATYIQSYTYSCILMYGKLCAPPVAMAGRTPRPVCMYVCVCICSWKNSKTCMYVCMCVCMYVQLEELQDLYVCMYVCMYVCAAGRTPRPVCIYVCMYVCMYVQLEEFQDPYIYIYIYIHIYIQMPRVHD